MKRYTIIIISMLLPMLALQAGKVEPRLAALVAKNVYFEKQYPIYSLDYQSISTKSIHEIKQGNTLVYYGIDLHPAGFVIVSATDAVVPVLGYSFEGNFQTDNLPDNYQGWMNHYADQILEAIARDADPGDAIRNDWKYWSTNDPAALNPHRAAKGVLPLIVSKWNQGKYYNSMCPADAAGPDGHCVTGCVATALGQILYYYRWPVTGLGSYTYQHPTYGTISADFGSTTYHWDQMVNEVTSPNPAVAELLFHLGVSVDMDYGPDGSGMWNHKGAYTLRTYFKSVPETQYLFRDSINLDWDSIILRHLDRKQILYYAGWAGVGSTSGHAFVCDGYQDSTYFHFNWGWGGSQDGYFYLNGLNPSGSNFNYAQELVINIHPDTVLYPYPPSCTGLQVLHSPQGTIEDGSGPIRNYAANASCSWLIDPQVNPEDSIKSLTLTFNKLETEAGSDILTIYNGNSTAAPVLGSYSGSSLPPVLQVPGNKALITWETNGNTEHNGWLISYKSNYPSYCSSGTLTEPSGQLSDGSGPKNYNNNTSCTWIIQPENAAGVKLHFESFNTEINDDFLEVYDLGTQTLLGKFSGNTIPPDVTAESGQMYLIFKSNNKNPAQGWLASYTVTNLSIDEETEQNAIRIFPNPAEDYLFFERLSGKPEPVMITLTGAEGKLMQTHSFRTGTGYHKELIRTDALGDGIYFMHIVTRDRVYTRKLIIRHP